MVVAAILSILIEGNISHMNTFDTLYEKAPKDSLEKATYEQWERLHRKGLIALLQAEVTAYQLGI